MNDLKLIGITGKAGSGKDTAARFITETVPGSRVKTYSFAAPLKDFAGEILGFSREQLYGPSSMRNAPDKQLSLPTYTIPVIGGLLTTVMRAIRLKKVVEARRKARTRFMMRAKTWLDEVLDPEICHDQERFEAAYKLLEAWLEDVLAQDVITPRYALQTLGTEFGRKVDEMIWVKYVLRKIRRFHQVNRFRDVIHVITDVRFLNEGQAVRAEGGEVWRVYRPDVRTLSAGAKGHASETEMDSPEWSSIVSRTINNSGTLEELQFEVTKNLAAYIWA